MISRIADSELRAQLEIDDRWDQKMCFGDDEKQAQCEYDWLKSHSNMREYKLISENVKADGLLNDSLPF